MFNKNKEKTYFITGGGTGGHIYPAVSVINELIENGVDLKNIFYLGNKKNLEYEIAKKNNYQFLTHGAKGMPRKLSLDFFVWALGLLGSTFKVMGYFIKHQPSVVFATGGYVCAPALICARLFKTPYVLHDCDIHPGIVTRAFAKHAKSVSLAFDGAKKFIKTKNIEVNGNPIRQEFKTISKKQAREEISIKDDFTILIMGGSLGARTINNSSFKILKEYANKKGVTILWQTGNKNFDDVTKRILELFEELPDNLILQPYFDKMYLALLSADLVISRAGSLSLSEICACGLPSILIPYPYAAADHQKKNAINLVENNISLMLEDKNCNDESLFELVQNLMNDKEKLSNLSYNAYKIAKLDSAKKIMEQINSAMEK
ncbi:MAG: undecaprenyldiphospho-muramoylpentapeptide beta-N-acetylglucosaminyltransferase [Candidatus Gastranaerophilales bacterium]|nr:undecaprenyldiphospho-muramoylpentapeptide beta-N-acetylglucosaminyltransferase [Candidatus Gastranaerophilales bacterium]